MLSRSTYTFSLLVVLSIFPANLFGKSLGYVWIAVNGFTEAVNYANESMNYVFNGLNGVPDVNSIVTLKSGNRIYDSYPIIEKINEKYVSLVGSGACPSYKGTTTGFMLNIQNETGCSVDSVLDEIMKELRPYYKDPKGEDGYYFLKEPRQVKVLGYVSLERMNFMLIEW